MDNNLSVVTNGKEYPVWAVRAVDDLFVKVKKKGLWETVEFALKLYLEKHPEFVQEQKDLQSSRANKHAAFKNKSNRLIVELPETINDFIHVFFDGEIKAMGQKRFSRELARRFPIFKVPEKI